MRRKWHMLMRFTALAAVLVLGLNLQPAQAAKGGGGKVTVTAAEPAAADQGQELDVYISGDGFDDGSTATFYVTGTSDDTQIVVESTTYEQATGQLKSHIKVNGTALVTDYDIEVKTAGGRRGKGTTLFKVQQTNREACTDFEEKEPKIAYLSEMYTVDKVNTWDIYLSSSSGCDQTLLLEAAGQLIPATGQSEAERISMVDSLRIHTGADRGLVVWADTANEPTAVKGMEFTYDADGNITPVTELPAILYASPTGRSVYTLDLAQNASGELELVMNSISVNSEAGGGWWLSTLNLATGLHQYLLNSQNCVLTDELGNCYSNRVGSWGQTTDEIFIPGYTEDYSSQIVARLQLTDGIWRDPEIIMQMTSEYIEMGFPHSVSSDGLATGETLRDTFNKGGKAIGRLRESWVIDLTTCTPSGPCLSGQGLLLNGTIELGLGAKWSADQRLISAVKQSNGLYRLVKSDLLSGLTKDLEITGVYRAEFAVSR